MKKIKFFVYFLLFFNFLHARICGLNDKTVNKIIFTYNYAKQFQANNGMTFNEAISTIFLLESGVGKEWLGDIDKSSENKIINNLVEASFGPGQIKLSTALLMIKNYDYLRGKYGYLYHDNIYAFQIYNKYFKQMAKYYHILNSPIWIKRWKNGQKLKVKEWALKEYKYWEKKYKKFLDVANKDLQIIKMLKDDYKFSIEIGTAFLIYNYENALKKHLSYPYYRAVSAYNGGWGNSKYLKKFFRYRKYIRCLKKEGFLD